MTDQTALTTYCAAFIDELSRAGIKHAVISPGSRSTPLALLLAEHPSIRIWLHVDERSAAFFALGLAKAKNEAVALLCTSGTAGANYYPAVIEAHMTRVPLVVITADRPHELRDNGAPQTIDQIHLFGNYPKWFVEMALPEKSEDMLRYARICAAKAVSKALDSPAGPVHVNFPLREPLLPNLDLPSLWESGQKHLDPFTEVYTGIRTLSDVQYEMIAKRLQGVTKGLIVCGPMHRFNGITDIIELGKQLNFPILADPLSQLRTGSHDKSLIIDSYDALLRVNKFVETYEPEIVIRFGAMPVSKALLLYLKKYRCQQVIVDEGAGWRDPTLSSDLMVYADIGDFCRQLVSKLKHNQTVKNDAWTSDWLKWNELARNIVNEMNLSAINEGQLMLETIRMLPDDALLFVGNSMPIRDLDTFLLATEKPIVTMGNRGANGIDGVVSTALGASTEFDQSVLVIGDLSFFHDLNGLLAAKLYDLNLTIIVVNNDGGGIFSFLPQADNNLPHFEQLFGTPIGVDFEHAVRMYGGRCYRANHWSEFRNGFEQSLSNKGLNVIEVFTDRKENVRIHRELWNEIEQQFARGFKHDI